ncbi:hypothetical protein [Paraherbaspirillum soli]|uniref:DUF4153 domain-containing protein n=1 Tax=Paraherbaspirillum soli TaxID=631222 RepID=A0ABW0ME72_9BURK
MTLVKDKQRLVTIFLAALVQGLSLYGLYWANAHQVWPATQPIWGIPLLLLAAGLPTAIQLSADLDRRHMARLLLPLIAIALVIGISAAVALADSHDVWSSGNHVFTLYFSSLVLGFTVLPFLQVWSDRQQQGKLYPQLFSRAWQNTLLLAETAFFTGVFWLILLLWGALFNVIKIRVFSELFAEPVFIVPITALAAGGAMYLAQTREAIALVLRKHWLGITAWLLPLIGFIALLFIASLAGTGLEPLWRTGKATFLMLWMVALLIKLSNSAYQDGEREVPYPAWLQAALRLALLTMPVFVGLCGYALWLRIAQYGWSVERIWAVFITAIAACYAIGYALAALVRQQGRWMHWIGRVNIVAAGLTIAGLLGLLSPLLSPQRIAAKTQEQRLLAGKVKAAEFDFWALRFNDGKYGLEVLRRLEQLDAHPEKEAIVAQAKEALTNKNRYDRMQKKIDWKDRLRVHPAGSAIPPGLLAYLNQDDNEYRINPGCYRLSTDQLCDLIQVDLNNDGQPDWVILGEGQGAVLAQQGDNWKLLGWLNFRGKLPNAEILQKLLEQKGYKTVTPQYRDLMLGGLRLRLTPAED